MSFPHDNSSSIWKFDHKIFLPPYTHTIEQHQKTKKNDEARAYTQEQKEDPKLFRVSLFSFVNRQKSFACLYVVCVSVYTNMMSQEEKM